MSFTEQFGKLADEIKDEYVNDDLLNEEYKTSVIEKLHAVSTMLAILEKIKPSGRVAQRSEQVTHNYSCTGSTL